MNTNDQTILIIDDDVDIRELMKMVLEVEGYHVDIAADGIDALHRLQAGERPRLILLDLMMPRMDGEQFLKELRSNRWNIPVILVSGHAGAQKKARELHTAGCLMKPVESDELLNEVRRFVPAFSHKDRL